MNFSFFFLFALAKMENIFFWISCYQTGLVRRQQTINSLSKTFVTNSDVVRYQQCLGSGLSGLLTIWGLLGLYLRGNLPVKLFFFFCQFPKMDFIMTSVHKWVCIIECAIFLYKCNLFYFVFVLFVMCNFSKSYWSFFSYLPKSKSQYLDYPYHFCHYFRGNYISNVSFNLCLFKRAIFAVIV